MTYIILFTDAADAAPDLRAQHMQHHLAFLETHGDVIKAAGPLSDPAGAGHDGLWIVHCASHDKAEALIHADPFWPTGLRASYQIIPWKQVFAGGKRQV